MGTGYKKCLKGFSQHVHLVLLATLRFAGLCFPLHLFAFASSCCSCFLRFGTARQHISLLCIYIVYTFVYLRFMLLFAYQSFLVCLCFNHNKTVGQAGSSQEICAAPHHDVPHVRQQLLKVGKETGRPSRNTIWQKPVSVSTVQLTKKGEGCRETIAAKGP